MKYNAFNLKITKHPLPGTEEIFAPLSNDKVYFKVDFNQLQMKVKPGSQNLVTIILIKVYVHVNTWCMAKLLLQLFSENTYIESVFQVWEGAEVFLDDVGIIVHITILTFLDWKFSLKNVVCMDRK